MPPPIRVLSEILNAFPTDFSGKQRAKPIPPEPDRFITDVDTSFVQKVFDVPQRKRKANVHHDRQANNLGAAVEILERIAFCHDQTLQTHPARLKSNPSDNAVLWIAEVGP